MGRMFSALILVFLSSVACGQDLVDRLSIWESANGKSIAAYYQSYDTESDSYTILIPKKVPAASLSETSRKRASELAESLALPPILGRTPLVQHDVAAYQALPYEKRVAYVAGVMFVLLQAGQLNDDFRRFAPDPHRFDQAVHAAYVGTLTAIKTAEATDADGIDAAPIAPYVIAAIRDFDWLSPQDAAKISK